MEDCSFSRPRLVPANGNKARKYWTSTLLHVWVGRKGKDCRPNSEMQLCLTSSAETGRHFLQAATVLLFLTPINKTQNRNEQIANLHLPLGSSSETYGSLLCSYGKVPKQAQEILKQSGYISAIITSKYRSTMIHPYVISTHLVKKT